MDANEELLEKETQDSGIVSSVGTDLRFWHLSFQEYLAAREIASLSDKQQIERVVESGKLYRPEWREMMRLLGGVLRQQGEAKIEGFFQAVLEKLPRHSCARRPGAVCSAARRDDARPLPHGVPTEDSGL